MAEFSGEYKPYTLVRDAAGSFYAERGGRRLQINKFSKRAREEAGIAPYNMERRLNLAHRTVNNMESGSVVNYLNTSLAVLLNLGYNITITPPNKEDK